MNENKKGKIIKRIWGEEYYVTDKTKIEVFDFNKPMIIQKIFHKKIEKH